MGMVFFKTSSTMLVAEQPLGAAQPARSDHAVAAQEVVDGDPDGGHGGRAGPAAP